MKVKQENLKPAEKLLYKKIYTVIRDVVQGNPNGLEIYNTPEKQAALQDVALLLAYLYKNYSLVSRTIPLDVQFWSIVVSGGLDSLLQEQGEVEKKQEQENQLKKEELLKKLIPERKLEQPKEEKPIKSPKKSMCSFFAKIFSLPKC